MSGRITDRTGRRKPFVVAGYGLSSVVKPLIGAAAAWPWVAGLRFVDRLGKGLRTSPRDAMIADVSEDTTRGAAYGLHRAMDHAGAVAGPLIAAGLLLLPGIGIRQVFYLAAILGVAVLLVLWFGVREPRRRPSPAVSADGGVDGRGAIGTDLRRMLVAVATFTLGNSTDAFLLLRFSDLGVATGWLAVLWAAHNLVRMAWSWVGGRWSDRVRRKPLMVAGWILYAVVYLGFSASSELVPLLVLFLVYGLYAVGFAALPASVLFGALYTTIGPGVAFGVGSTLAAESAVILIGVPDPRPVAAPPSV